jgi:predicted component of type VI protein secretion system
MAINYLKLPLRFQHFFEKQKMPICTIQESISRNIHLLITTSTDENRFDEFYGSAFWDNDYDIHLTNSQRKELIIEGVTQQISRYEKRLSKVVVQVNVKQAPFNDNGNLQLKRRIEIIITGLVARSNEPYSFQTGFFIGPLAFD